MTQAEKDGHCAMLDDAEKAAFVAIERVQAESGIDMAAEAQRIKSAFFQMRDRVNSAQLTKD